MTELKKRLVFGDIESINMLRVAESGHVANHLVKTVKCPECRARAMLCFTKEPLVDRYGIEFGCKYWCKNFDRENPEKGIGYAFFNSRGEEIT